MKSVIIALVIGVFVIVSGLQAFGEELTAEQKEVWQIIQRGWENFKTGDVDSSMANRHDKMIKNI